MDSQPLVSVILPTYNRADYIRRSILSVLSQTYKNFELLVIDDGSTDATSTIVQSFDDDRIRYIKHNQNMGANVARNTGIKNSEGDLIAFQDSDDLWLPNKLSLQVQKIESSPNHVGVVYSGTTVVRDDGVEYFPDKFYEGNIQSDLSQGNFIPTQVSLVRKECFQEYGLFDTALDRLQDWELWLRLSSTFEFSYIDEPLTQTYMGVDELSIGLDNEAKIESLEYILEKHKSLFSQYPSSYSTHLLSIGDNLIRSGDIATGRNYIKRAFIAKPRLIIMLALILSYSGRRIYACSKNIFSSLN